MRSGAPQAVHETYELKEGPPWAEVDGDAHTTLVFIGGQFFASSITISILIYYSQVSFMLTISSSQVGI